MEKEVRVRVAPSPTGFVHVGNTQTAYLNYIFARQNEGKFILRLDDTDTTREVSGAVEEIYTLWRWLGLVWDEGPDIGPATDYQQSLRKEVYRAKAEQLLVQGDAYKKDGAVFFRIKNGAPVVVPDLIRGEVIFERKDIKDLVILKKNGMPTYHFATAVDEIEHRISHVIRGEDHLSNTPKQILIIRALGAEEPRYAHTSLLRNPDSSKLSKRQSHTNLRWYKQEGVLPEALKNYMSLLGWTHPQEKEVFSEEEFTKIFSLADMNTTAPVFDIEKLYWLNGNYIREKSAEDVYQVLLNYYQDISLKEKYRALKDKPEYTTKVIELTQERLKKLADFWEQNSYFFTKPTLKEEQILKFIEREEYLAYMNKVHSELNNIALENWQTEIIDEKLHQIQQEFGLKPKAAFMSVRYAISGLMVTPPLFDTLFVLGKDTVLTRLQEVLTQISPAD